MLITMWRDTWTLVTTLFCVGWTPLFAQPHETEHTFREEPGKAGPHATLQDIAWLNGVWQGSAFGGISEEIWSEPGGGSMMGVYRSVENGTVRFYEINAIVETNGSLAMKLKHFNADLTGWEEKAEVRTFPLVRVTNHEICFDGMTYKRTGRDTLIVYLAVKAKDGTVKEIVFDYRRKRS